MVTCCLFTGLHVMNWNRSQSCSQTHHKSPPSLPAVPSPLAASIDRPCTVQARLHRMNCPSSLGGRGRSIQIRLTEQLLKEAFPALHQTCSVDRVISSVSSTASLAPYSSTDILLGKGRQTVSYNFFLLCTQHFSHPKCNFWASCKMRNKREAMIKLTAESSLQQVTG